MRSTASDPVSLKSVLILFSHLYIILLNYFYCPEFVTKILYVFLISPMLWTNFNHYDFHLRRHGTKQDGESTSRLSTVGTYLHFCRPPLAEVLHSTCQNLKNSASRLFDFNHVDFAPFAFIVSVLFSGNNAHTFTNICTRHICHSHHMDLCQESSYSCDSLFMLFSAFFTVMFLFSTVCTFFPHRFYVFFFVFFVKEW